jgi:transcriptional regulator of met regulon
MPSKLNSPSVEGEAELTKDEEVLQVTNTQVDITYNRTRIKIFKVMNNRVKIRVSNLKEAEGEDQMTNQAYNAITAKSMGTMNLNARRSTQISSRAKKMCQIIREKPQEVCFSHATRLKNNLKIYGC